MDQSSEQVRPRQVLLRVARAKRRSAREQADRGPVAIRRARDGEVTLFDMARLYGWGKSKTLLGTALAPILLSA